MYLKRYTIGSVFFILFVGWYVSQFLGYSQTESISLFGLSLPSLPVAILVLLPVIVLYIMTVLHMMYYSVKGYFKLRNYQKDYDKLIEAITNALLLKHTSFTYKTDRYKLLGQVVDNVNITPVEKFGKTDNEKINAALEVLHDLKEGKTVDLKKFNLPDDNALVLQNNINRMKNADLTPESILNKKEKYTQEVLEKAFEDYIVYAPVNAIEKHQEYITKDALFSFLSRVNSGENGIEVSDELIISLMNRVDLNKHEYIEISKKLSSRMIPEQRMKLFETLSEQNEEAQEAYLYTLFDLEMIDQAKEFLDSVGKDDMLKFRAYLALKESGQNYNINLFI